MFNNRHQDLPLSVWLLLPVASYIGLYGILITRFPHVLANTFAAEQGLLENAQVLFLLLCLGCGLNLLRIRRPLPHSRLRLWLVLLMAGCLYTLGEEVSWGQHYIGWMTPEWLGHLNAQGETNLHNVNSDMFFRIPRTLFSDLPYNLLLVAIYIGGLAYPIYTRGQRQSWYWPTPVCMPWAALTAVADLPIEVGTWLDYPLHAYIRAGEMQEYFVYGFLWIYLYSLAYRLRRHKVTPPTSRDTCP